MKETKEKGEGNRSALRDAREKSGASGTFYGGKTRQTQYGREGAGSGQYGGKKGRNPYKDDGFYHSFDPDEFFELAIRHSEKLMEEELGGGSNCTGDSS